ncbi:mechanosensitive ion channel protein MscS [Methanomicrobiaceae archaeon CYW5]|uniref:mechanosensitive ion channel family protein n=1 Tax=Methanovulcanius yangii TaxID=1789227 RepID=UPI0029CA06CA|nr:mechanosensitive ion channel family protein [Methanovulcanius yangii]MBT8507427.1 mechanosensitive ion channel protein MscS [Methanovulcanius yangii]
MRQAGYFSLFFVIAVILNRGYVYYPYPELLKLSFTFLAVALIYLVYVVLSIIATRYIADKKTRYSLNKALFILSILAVGAIVIRIWVEETQSLLISYGILAAGVAIALQDILRNFVGGVYIMVSGMYRVGDRISIGDMAGDVMDVGIMNSTLMEIGQWVQGDQPTGRIVIIPNAVVITDVVYNFTKDHNFVWDEITIPLTYDSDWKTAMQVFFAIVHEETAELTLQAEAEIERIGEKYYLPKKVVEPSIYLSLTDNWIRLDIRYVTDTRQRRILRDRIMQRLMEALDGHADFSIASETIEVQGTHTVTLNNAPSGGTQ